MGRRKILDEFTDLPVPAWRKAQLRRAKLVRSERAPAVRRALKGELERLYQEISRLHEELPEPYTEDSHDGGAHEYIDKVRQLIKTRLQALTHEDKEERGFLLESGKSQEETA